MVIKFKQTTSSGSFGSSLFNGEDVFYNDFEKYSVSELMHWFRSDSIKEPNYKAGYAASDVANYAKHCCSNYTLKELDENKFVRFDVSDRIKAYISESVRPKNARYETFMVLCTVIDDPKMKEELQPLVANKEACLVRLLFIYNLNNKNIIEVGKYNR